MSESDENSPFAVLGKEHYGLTAQVAVTMDAAMNAKTIATSRGKPGGDWLLATSLTNYSIIVYKGEHLGKLAALQGHKKMITGLKFSDTNSNILYSSSLDATMRIWDLRLGKSVKEFEDYSDEKFRPITSFDVNCDETFLCGGTEKIIGDSYLLFWDLRQSKLLGGYWESHTDDITQVRFHETEASTLATGSTDGLINLFDISEANEDEALSNTFNTQSSVDVIRWCHDGADLACLTHVETVQLWNIERAELLKTYERDDIRKELQINYGLPTRFLNLVTNRSTGSPAVIATTRKNAALLIEIEESGLVVHSELQGVHKSFLICADWDVEKEWAVTADESAILCRWKKGAEPTKDSPDKLKTTSSLKKKMSNRSESRTKPY